MAVFTFLMVVIFAAAAVILIIALYKFSRINPNRFQKSLSASRELIHKEQYAKAEKRLMDALRNIGWDYGGLLAARQGNRLVGIEGLRSVWFQLARALKVFSDETLEWSIPGFFMLGEIFEKNGNNDAAYKLYEDLTDYLVGYPEAVSRVVRTKAKIEIANRMAKIDLIGKNYLSALKHHAAGVLEGIQLAKLQNDELAFRERYPYQGDPFFVDILKKMEREDDIKVALDTINRSVNEKLGRIFIDRAQKELNDLLLGRKTYSSKEREATREILIGILEKATSEREKEKVEEETKDDVILL